MPLPEHLEFTTDRLLLTPVREDHLADLLRVNGDDEVTQYLPYASWTSLTDGQAWLTRMRAMSATGTALQLVILSKDTGLAIGTLLLLRYEASHGRLELGYVLGRDHWRRGYMHEAVAATCALAFERLGARRIEAEVHPDNRTSSALLERIGFTLEGRLRQRWTAKGRAYDTLFYGLLKGEDIHPPRSDDGTPARGRARDDAGR